MGLAQTRTFGSFSRRPWAWNGAASVAHPGLREFGFKFEPGGTQPNNSAAYENALGTSWPERLREAGVFNLVFNR